MTDCTQLVVGAPNRAAEGNGGYMCLGGGASSPCDIESRCKIHRTQSPQLSPPASTAEVPLGVSLQRQRQRSHSRTFCVRPAVRGIKRADPFPRTYAATIQLAGFLQHQSQLP
jgi:hypothetical protein